MTRYLLLLVAFFAVVTIPALLDSEEPHQLGSGERVPAYPPGVEPVDNVPTLAPGVATTTTRRVRAASASISARTWSTEPGSVNGYPCGGELPTCRVLACESGGNPTAENPTSSASGLWQILDSTWAGFGGYTRASHAPVDVQNAKAAALWAGGRGAFHWKACL